MIILARHGQTEWNKLGRLQGWEDAPLTDLGRQQASRVAKVVSKLIDGKEFSLFSSPLGRAHETARIISNSLDGTCDISLDPLLKEYSYGNWAGLTTAEVKEQWQSEWGSRIKDKWNYIVPGGESYSLVSERAKEWLAALPQGKTILAVTHQMIGRTIRGAYLGLDEANTMALTHENNEVIVLKNGAETKLSAF